MPEPKIYYLNFASSGWKINPSIPKYIVQRRFYTKEQIFFWEATRCLQPVNRLGDNNKLPISYRPIQNYDSSWDKSFFDIAIETAENLWKLDKPIKVAWSGGIDSTVAAVALILTKPTDADLTFIYSQSAIDEYPLFYEKYIKDYNKPFEKENLFDLLNSYPDSIIVTGEAGDQTFGSDWIMNMDLSERSQPWENVLNWDEERWNRDRNNKWFRKHGLTELYWINLSRLGTKAEREETLYNFIKKCPVSNPVLEDFFWWTVFVNKYDWVNKRFHILHAQNPDIGEKFKSFFDNPEFEMWSMDRRVKGLNKSKSKKDYKMAGKEFICNFTKDTDYRDNKVKYASMIHVRNQDLQHSTNSLKLVLSDGRFWRDRDSFSEKDTEMLKKLLTP